MGSDHQQAKGNALKHMKDERVIRANAVLGRNTSFPELRNESCDTTVEQKCSKRMVKGQILGQKFGAKWRTSRHRCCVKVLRDWINPVWAEKKEERDGAAVKHGPVR